MNRNIIVLILFLATVSAVIAAIKKTEEIEPVSSASKTIGDTRVTLVNIARTVTLSNQYVHGHDDKKGQLYAVPGVYVEFIIERLGDTPIKTGPHFGGTEFWENGKKISALGSVIHGDTGEVKQYKAFENRLGFDMPETDNPDRAYIQFISDRGIVFTSKRIEVRIQTGFDDKKPQWFVFENIPIY